MKATPSKFLVISVEQLTLSKYISFSIGENIVCICEDSLKLLCVTLDFQLSFNENISNVCKKASRQVNALKRIGGPLCKL